MAACVPCNGTGSFTSKCGACKGSGESPPIETKVAVHLMNSPEFGLQLAPWEVAELGLALGLTPPPVQEADDAGPVQPS